MSVNGINPNGTAPNFTGEKKKSSGIGAGLVLGTGTYLGLHNFVKSPMDQDTFQSSLKNGTEIKYTSELDAKEKDLVKKAEVEAKKETPKTETKSETKEAPKAEVKKEGATTEAKETPKTEAKGNKEVERIFGKKSELTASDYLTEKYNYEVTSTEDLENRIKEARKNINGQDKTTKANNPNLFSRKKAVNGQTGLLQKGKQLANDEINIYNKFTKAKTDLVEYKLEMELRGQKPDLKVIENRTATIKNLEKQAEELDKKFGKLADPKINENFETKFDEKSEKELEKALEKANSENGSITKAGKNAEKRALDFLKGKAKKEALEYCKAQKSTAAETKAFVEETLKNVTLENPEVQEKVGKLVDFAKLKETEKITREVTTKRMQLMMDKLIKNAKHESTRLDRKIQTEQVNIKEMEADLKLVREAKKTGKGITKETAAGILENKATAKAKIESEVKKASSVLTEAFEAIKAKLPKVKMSHMKAGLIGGGVALGTILIASLAGGKKEE